MTGKVPGPDITTPRHLVEGLVAYDAYFYRCTMRRVVDGDTFRADVDFGMNRVQLNYELRLFRIDAWEKNRRVEKLRGLAARDYCVSVLPAGAEFWIHTEKDKTGKYGRLLADVYLLDGTCLNDTLVELGHALYEAY